MKLESKNAFTVQCPKCSVRFNFWTDLDNIRLLTKPPKYWVEVHKFAVEHGWKGEA